MRHNAPMVARRSESSAERAFYLDEFRGRTLAIACAELDAYGASALRSLRRTAETLSADGTRVVLMSAPGPALARLAAAPAIDAEKVGDRLEATLWRTLRAHGRAGVACAASPRGHPLARFRRLAARLGVFKIVWIDEEGGLIREGGERVSFVNRGELRRLRREGTPLRRALLQEVERLLAAGVGTVNVCAMGDVRRELLTYQGVGTLFTQDRYVDVRPLKIDDFAAANALISRGIREGFLVRRPRSEIDRALGCGFGAFVEERHLAGVASLVPYARKAPAHFAFAEIACLYTVNRFLGEGVGALLVAAMLREARRARIDSVFACTTQEVAAAFFRRQGFEAILAESLPEQKWRGYDTRRRQRVRCFAKETAREK